MTNLQQAIIITLFCTVCVYSYGEDTTASTTASAPVPEAPPVPTQESFATFGEKIQTAITTCEKEQNAICVSVVIPFDLFKAAMKALQLQTKSI